MNHYEFTIGALVCHRHYHYRGVVVGCDPRCLADDDWYLRNRTQPERDQPWYHVLVHGGEHSTYAAESNLTRDEGGEQVVHPLVRVFFEHFASGHYLPRTGIEFPGTARFPAKGSRDSGAPDLETP